MVRRLGVNYSKLCVLILACTVLYNEFLTYWLSSLSWARLPTPGNRRVILLVADPQIVGDLHEPGGIVGLIRRWDCDRYLSKSYHWAMSSYQVDTVIFLGDLIDEGSEADEEKYEEYVRRINSIYPRADNLQMIYIPGDNDIGGEGVDPVTITKMERFDKHFGPVKPVYPSGSNIDIVPVSRLTEHGAYNLTLKPAQLFTTKIVVAVSHVPVLPLNGRFSERVMNLVNPDLIISAHDHRGYLFTAERESRHIKGDVRRFSRADTSPVELVTRTDMGTDTELGVGQLTSEVSEIVVPTASYRMGVPTMGLGLVSLSSQGEIFYSNLWLPARFSLLYTYAASLGVVIIILLVGKSLDLRRLFRRKEDHAVNSRANYESLLRL